jgi:hypothetical protein
MHVGGRAVRYNPALGPLEADTTFAPLTPDVVELGTWADLGGTGDVECWAAHLALGRTRGGALQRCLVRDNGVGARRHAH